MALRYAGRHRRPNTLRHPIAVAMACVAVVAPTLGVATPAGADDATVRTVTDHVTLHTTSIDPKGTLTAYADLQRLTTTQVATPSCLKTNPGEALHPAFPEAPTEAENPTELADHDGEVALPPILAAASIAVTQCVPTTVVADTDAVTVNEIDVVRYNSGTSADGYDARGGSGPDSLKNARQVGRDNYGTPFPNPKTGAPLADGSNVWANWFMYASKIQDDYGRTLALWQSPVASIYDAVDLQRYRTFMYQRGGAAVRYESASPLGTYDVIDSSAAITAGFTVGIQDPKSGAYIEFNGSKTFNVDHTTFTGGLIADGSTVHGTLGGYRHIARKQQHARSRAFDQVGVWTFPPGAQQVFEIQMDIIAWCHRRDCS